MHPLVRSFLAVLAGIVVGSIVNMALIFLNMLVALPPGIDRNDQAALSAAFADAPPSALILVLLAHSGGTLVGAWLAAKLAGRAPLTHGLIVGVWFLIGGIVSIFMIRSPAWFIPVDLVLYLPAAWLGAKLTGPGKRVIPA